MKLSKMHQRVLSKAPYQHSMTDSPIANPRGKDGNKADKGMRAGSCNRTLKQRPEGGAGELHLCMETDFTKLEERMLALCAK